MDCNVWIWFIGEMLNGIVMMMLMFFFVLYLKDKVDLLLEVGVIMVFFLIVVSFGLFIGGRIVDIYGRKFIMIFFMVSNVLLMFGFLFIEGFILYVILFIFLGLSNFLFYLVVLVMVVDVMVLEKRIEVYGLLWMGYNIGVVIGLIMGVLVVVLLKNFVFIIVFFIMLFYVLFVLFFI